MEYFSIFAYNCLIFFNLKKHFNEKKYTCNR